MPIAYHIDPILHLVFSQASGVLTEAETDAHYARMKQDPEFRSSFGQLCDLQSVSELKTSRHFLQNLAMGSIFDRGTRRAVVAPSDHYYGLGRMLQAFSDLDGRDVAVFRSEAEAREWLGI